MLRLLFLSVVLLAFIAPSTSIAVTDHWFGTIGRVDLGVDSTKVAVKLINPLVPDGGQSLIQTVDRLVSIVDTYPSVDEFFVCSLSTSINYAAFLDSLKQVANIYLVEPAYTMDDSIPFVVGETFCVLFNTTVSDIEIQELVDNYSISIDYRFGNESELFVFKNNPLSGYETVELANLFHEMPQVAQAHPVASIPRISMDCFHR